VGADFPSRDVTAESRGASGYWIVAIGAVLAGWTLAILVTRHPTFRVLSSEAREPLEAAAATVITLVCVLAYIQYSLTNSTTAFFTGLAFLALASNQIVFGVFLRTGSFGITAQQEMYFWTVGRLFSGILLAISAVGGTRWAEVKRPSTRFLVGAVLVLGSQAAIQGILWSVRGHLPALSSVTNDVAAANANGPLPGLTAIDLGLGISGTLLFLSATGLYERRLRWDSWALPWLPAALLLAAFSHLHYMFFPTVFRSYLSTADFLRFGFMMVLALGIVWEVRRAYHAEHELALKLAAAYQVERRRVIELETQDRSRNELFSLLTHELLHPVATIRAFALTFLNRWDTTPEAIRVRMMERLESESRRLRELAEEATTITNLDTEGFSLIQRSERAVEFAREAAEMVDELGGRLKVTVDDTVEPARVYADRARILQALRNLLSNAEKYSEEGTPVELALTDGNGEVTFSVRNQGPGIAAEDIPRLFMQFSRTHPPGKETVPGSGLGLYIAKRIVESHGGRIWVDSRPGDETTFSFSLSALEETDQ
jgi:signal transduction histidine kinase